MHRLSNLRRRPCLRIVALEHRLQARPLAVEPDTMFPPLEACMEAALQKQEGVVVRWELTPTGTRSVSTIDVLAPNDYGWTMKCTEGKVGAPVRKVGNKDYKKLTSRVKVPEKSARFTAVGAYPHVAEMQQDAAGSEPGLKGKPYYTYETVARTTGAIATVEVNADHREIDYTEVGAQIDAVAARGVACARSAPGGLEHLHQLVHPLQDRLQPLGQQPLRLRVAAPSGTRGARAGPVRG